LDILGARIVGKMVKSLDIREVKIRTVGQNGVLELLTHITIMCKEVGIPSSIVMVNGTLREMMRIQPLR